MASAAGVRTFFLRVAKKTTGIASINKTQLSAFPVVVSPIAMQRAFTIQAEFARRIAALCMILLETYETRTTEVRDEV